MIKMLNDLREFIEAVEKLRECKVAEGADWDIEIEGKYYASILGIGNFLSSFGIKWFLVAIKNLLSTNKTLFSDNL